MSFPHNQQVIEAFSPHSTQEPFADCVGLWSAVGRLSDFNGACRCDSDEFITVHAVPVVDQEAWGQVKRDGLPQLLCDPGIGQVMLWPKTSSQLSRERKAQEVWGMACVRVPDDALHIFGLLARRSEVDMESDLQ